MKRAHWSTWLGAALLGLPTLAAAGLVAFAVLSLRSPGSDSGADPIAWVFVMGAAVLFAALMAGVGALIAMLVRRLLRGGAQPQK